MKKLIAILCAGFLTIGLSAQTDQGNMYLGVSGGSAGSGITFMSTSYEYMDDSQTDMNLMLNGGYFATDNLCVMALLGISSYKSGDFEGGQTMFGIGAKYYINGLFPFASYGSSKQRNADESMSVISFGAGYALMLNYLMKSQRITYLPLD